VVPPPEMSTASLALPSIGEIIAGPPSVTGEPG